MVQVAIVGGGIGGLTTALALKQSGFDSEVFEQAPALHDVGAAIAVWPNAMRILDRLNLADQVLAKAGVMREIRWVDQNGWLINRVSLSEQPPAVALHRADLQHILAHSLPPSAIHLGNTLVNYSQQHNKMIASFANGSPIEADLLIGADGLHSHVREQLLNDGDPVYRGYIVWRGISPTTPATLAPDTAIEIHGRGKRFGIGPVGLGRTGWWASANDPDPAAVDTQHKLLCLFHGWYPPVVDLIEATPQSSILTTRAFDRPANTSWGAGRMTLLGDAIHPTTPNLGQGGCLAMEDAIVLARCFERFGAVEEALRTYERCQYKRTKAISSYSRLYGSIGQWENVWARGLRKAALALTPESLAHRLMDIVLNYDATRVALS